MYKKLVFYNVFLNVALWNLDAILLPLILNSRSLFSSSSVSLLRLSLYISYTKTNVVKTL